MPTYSEIFADIKRAMDGLGPIHAGPIYGGSPLMNALDQYAVPAKHPSYYGVQVKPSNLFPYEAACAECNGTGDGGESATYCPKCKGQGANRYEGCMVQGEQMIVITSPLPKKFQPRWPTSIAVPLRRLDDNAS